MSASVCDGSVQQPSTVALMLTDSISNTSVSLLCEDDDKAYTGPSPGELLEPLFKRPSCSYRVRLGSILTDTASHLVVVLVVLRCSNLKCSTLQIESYWTYEVCHGKHVRQYHEEKETGQVSVLCVQKKLKLM